MNINSLIKTEQINSLESRTNIIKKSTHHQLISLNTDKIQIIINATANYQEINSASTFILKRTETVVCHRISC